VIQPGEGLSDVSGSGEEGEWKEERVLVVMMEEGGDLPACTCRPLLPGMPASRGF